jgi:hypothetical protein
METGNLRAAGANPIEMGRWGSPWLLLAGLPPVLHILMFGYDLQHPDRFLNADRAIARMQVIEGFEQILRDGGDSVSYLTGHGIIGDWLPQAILYLCGGQSAVIAVQVLLALLSILWVRDIGLRLGLTAPTACAAALLYGLLPHTLVLPHQLASEAIFVPLVVGSFALFARAAETRGLTGAGALLGVATLVRPVTLLWPLLCAPFMPATPRARVRYLLAALGPLLLWMLFIFGATGEFSMGRSSYDLDHNLYLRAQHIAATLPASERSVRGGGDPTLSLREYAAFVSDHPGAVLAHSARDLLVLSTKSGVERIAFDYLDFAPAQRMELQSPANGWRRQLELHGVWAGLREISNRNPSLTLAAAGGALLFSGLMLLAAVGAFVWLRAAPDDTAASTRGLRIMLAAFPLYIVTVSQVVDAAQSRHRAPAEFALCLLAAAGVGALLRGLKSEARHAR